MGKSSTSFKKGHVSYSYKDEIGKKYGKLTIIERAENSKYSTARFLCKCDCGNEKIICASSMRLGKSKSCGCPSRLKPRSGNIIYTKMMGTTRWQARKNKIPFTLTLEDVKTIVHKDCTYCGRSPYLKRRAYHKSSKTKGIDTDESLLINGIDKVIPKLGYVLENCVPCCKYCNRAKSDLSVEEFKELISKIYEHYVK